jgi:putative ABC transport system permease protein
VTSAVASADFFTTLGVPPAMGRPYSREEDLPGADPVVVLSHELWRTAFGGDPSLVGRTVEVNGQARVVVGITPPGFDIDDQGIQLWLPLALDPANRQNRGSHFLNLVGRLAPGVTLAQATAEMESLLHQWPELNPGTHTPSVDNHRMFLIPLREDVVGEIRTALLLLLGAVGLVLLIACANVANLLLARAESRQKEVAVRVALGAGGGRLLRQFLTEGVMLAGMGGALGVAVAWAALRVLLALSPGSIPRLGEIGLDPTVLLFTGGLAVAAGVLFGLAPALHLRARAVGGTLREGGQRTTVGSGRARLRRLLVMSEMGLAVVLAVGAGLMLRSFAELTRVDVGFEPEGVLTFQLALPPAGYPDAGAIQEFHRRLQQELSALPGVRAVASMTGLPPLRDLNANDTEFEGYAPGPNDPPANVDYYQNVTAGYLETMRIPVVAGRGFVASDEAGDLPVLLVNETLARLYYPGQEAVGRRIRPCCGDRIPWFTIVGVAKDVKQGGVDAPAGTELYFLADQVLAYGTALRTMNYVVRTDGDPEVLASAVRQAVWRVDGALPVAGLQAMESVVSGAVSRPRFLTTLLSVFALLALALAAVGTYGVMSYTVAERAREIGIRMALGAESGSVLGLVLRQGAAVAGIGLLLGVAASLGLAGLLESLLFGVGARDLTTFLAAPLLLALVALAACLVPARRATRMNPVDVLRQDG